MLVVQVLADYHDDTETLNEVMAPVEEQTERTRESLKKSGNMPEVDPETGEPVESEDGEGDEGS